MADDELKTLLKDLADTQKRINKRMEEVEAELKTVRQTKEPQAPTPTPVEPVATATEEPDTVKEFIKRQMAREEEREKKKKERTRVRTRAEIDHQASDVLHRMLTKVVEGDE